MVEIIPYEAVYHDDFKKLNLEWLEKFNLVESHDLEILNDPEGTVLEAGGFIFLARVEEKIIGTAGLWKQNDKEFEMIKMSVGPDYRGRGIGQQLLLHCVEIARQQKAEKIFLFSNSQLREALQLYKKFGFRHVEVTDAPFETADVKMELIIS